MAMHFKQNLISSILANSFKNIKQTATEIGKSLSNINLKSTHRGIQRNYSDTKDKNNKGKIHEKNSTILVLENTKSNINYNRIVKRQLCIRHETVDRNPKYTKLHKSNSTGVKKGRIEKSKVRPKKIYFSNYKKNNDKHAEELECSSKQTLQANKKCNTHTCPRPLALRCKKIQMPNCISAYKRGCEKINPSPSSKPKPKAPQPSFLECLRDPLKISKDWRKECKYMNQDIRPHKFPLQWHRPRQ